MDLCVFMVLEFLRTNLKIFVVFIEVCDIILSL